MSLVYTLERVYFNLSYRFGFAQWDTNEPQPTLVDLVEGRSIKGKSVIDVGCGSGDNSIYLARKGYEVIGVDYSRSGIKAARKRAELAEAHVEFLVADALELSEIGRTFDSAIDFGLFHQFRGENITAYVDNLSSVLRPGGQLILQCFNEEAPAEKFGPRLLSREDLAMAFRHGWRIELIRPAAFSTSNGTVPAWLALIERC